MPTSSSQLVAIKTFEQLKTYLEEELDWPIDEMEIDDITFNYDPEEDLGLDPNTAAKIKSIKQLRPLTHNQPFGIFFVEFDRKKLPVVAMRRILGKLVTKKRESANESDRARWLQDDLIFASAYGQDEQRRIDFAHFSDDAQNALPTLRVLGWDAQDTQRKLDWVDQQLRDKLTWPDGASTQEWREQWRSAFTLRHRESITTSKELAKRLSELAKNIRTQVNDALEVESDAGPITTLMNAFKEALIHDLEPDDFADMYAQTIAYGLLSIEMSKPGTLKNADAIKEVHVTSPFLREMMEMFINVGGRRFSAEKGKLVGIDFDELGVNDVVDTLRETNMEAIRNDFGRKNPQEDPVIFFYEDFLSAYDKSKKISRGVFYTPKPVVSYIVRSVHELLQTEFGLELGLADTTTWGEMLEKHKDMKLPLKKERNPLAKEDEPDEYIDPDTPFVQILDPATGTATFLIEVIDVIHKTMLEHWKSQGVTGELTLHQKWNEYVPRHLLSRIYGYELMMAPYAIAHMKIGLKLSETGYTFSSDERARIYLTNALEPSQDFSDQFEQMVPALAHEALAVNDVKRYTRFTVVIGNPPYSISSANHGDWINRLIAIYKQGLDETNLNSLSDDYIKFIGLSQHLAEASGVYVVGLITNNSYLDGITHRRIRELVLCSNLVSVVNLHGSVMQRHEIPESCDDENVFDIQQGVAIAIFTPRTPAIEQSVIYADLIGTRADKYLRLTSDCIPETKELHPQSPYFFFKPKRLDGDTEYIRGYPLNKVFIKYSSGIKFRKDNLLVKNHFTRLSVEQMLRDVVRLADVKLLAEYEFKETPDWKLKDKRHLFTKWKSEDIVKVMYRALDFRYAFYPLDRANKIIVRGDSRVELMKHVLLHKNIGLQFNRQIVGESVSHFLASRVPTSQGTFYLGNKGQDYFAPLYLFDNDEDSTNVISSSNARANFTPEFLVEIAGALHVERDVHGLPDGLTPEDIFHYAYGVFHSPGYRDCYAEFLKIDFPRLPLTGEMGLFHELARFGGELTALHLMESQLLDNLITTFTGPSNPEMEKVSYTPQDQTVWLDKAQTRGFVGVPEEVWNFHIGGYQVCHKWLKDRQAKGGKNPRPGRILTDEDIAHYQKIVVAIKETIRIMGEIDEVIDAHGGWPDAFITDPDELEKLKNNTGTN
jgi:type I restriction-modification system DNA methylase subunit